jgi:hypothetical protein
MNNSSQNTVQSRIFESWLFEVPFHPHRCAVVKVVSTDRLVVSTRMLDTELSWSAYHCGHTCPTGITVLPAHVFFVDYSVLNDRKGFDFSHCNLMLCILLLFYRVIQKSPHMGKIVYLFAKRALYGHHYIDNTLATASWSDLEISIRSSLDKDISVPYWKTISVRPCLWRLLNQPVLLYCCIHLYSNTIYVHSTY